MKKEDELTPEQGLAFRDIAAYLRSQNIPAPVLHGVNAITGELGRDVDLFIPDHRQAYRVALQFAEILRQHGAKWVTLTHPFRGPRAIGVRERDLCYWELHMFTRMQMRCIAFEKLFPAKGVEGPLGFNFDPSWWFIKAVLFKYLNEFAQGLPVWSQVPAAVAKDRQGFPLAHKEQIESEFQQKWRGGAEFVAAVLGPDTDDNLRTRRKGLFALKASNCLLRPVNAAIATATGAFRRAEIYASPTVPVYGIDTPIESPALKELLTERFYAAFNRRFIVADAPVDWRLQRWMQAMQSMVMYRREGSKKNQKQVDVWISIPTSDPKDVDAGLAAILDGILPYNARWEAVYRQRSL